MSITGKVRVLMITYNGDKFFEQQLNSILAQSEIESIQIYDDHSGKKFKTCLEELGQNDKRIVTHSNEQNIGVVRNIKKALAKNLDAKYIALADQDDVWLPKKIEITLEEMEKIDKSNTPSLVYHDMGIIDENGKQSKQTFWGSLRYDTFQHSLEANLTMNLITGSASLINSSLAAYAKDIPENLNIYHDAWLGMVAYTMGNVKCIKQPLSLHRTHSNSLTFSQNQKQSHFTRLFKNFKQIMGLENHLEEQFLFLEAFLEKYRGIIPQKHKSKLESFLLHKNRGYLAQKNLIWGTQNSPMND